ncbi:ubiquitin-like-conjugating enzyme ATG10 isoform X3 [Colossoma macropomum]|uniref:ubiquitin-like-conjugating enzyme ATG10 isoform X3 n=1 Tax=Colossoma macropomum TaxID=42526 RepID=UPI00186543A4|nr:ubiquitin-like-conjugating enzyme ATG10 isoform X3 [Colossoma macropomum]
MMSDKEESSAARCYLDEKSFHICCQLFLQHSSVLKDGWSWTEFKGVKEGYMKKTVLIPGRFSSLLNQFWKHKTENMDALVEDQVDDDDEDQAVCENQAVMCYEYHVLYSCSYQVPILYFRASTLDGRLLSLEEVWNNIHPNYRKRLLQGPWDTLTQQSSETTFGSDISTRTMFLWLSSYTQASDHYTLYKVLAGVVYSIPPLESFGFWLGNK